MVMSGGGAQGRKHGGNSNTDRGRQREEHKRHLKGTVEHGNAKQKHNKKQYQ